MAPNFELKNQQDETRTLADYKGKWLVLYFYPKDNTSGCTREAISFTELKREFDKLNCQIAGVSPDSTERYRGFIEKSELGIELLSDPEKGTLRAYEAFGKKKLYGKEYEGVIRSTFIINPEGKIAYKWKNVKVNGHVEKVLEKLKAVQQ